MNFYVAMLAECWLGQRNRPHIMRAHEPAKLIVGRSSGTSELLTVAWISVGDNARQTPPRIVRGFGTAVGRLIRRERTSFVERYTMMRHAPRGLALEGPFVPAEGYASLWLEDEALHLEMEAHGVLPQQINETGWRLLARYEPWVGEVLSDYGLKSAPVSKFGYQS